MNTRFRSLSFALLSTLAASASATEPSPSPSPSASGLTAELSCQRGAGPGRILCELTTRARTGQLVWCDALVMRAPQFARPLRSRFVAQLDASGAPKASAKLALVAASAGEGKLELLARAVVCRDGANGQWCAPEVLPVSAQVSVGPPISGP